MNWNTSRIEALLKQALVEDKAANDATTLLTVDAGLQATATILARQELVVCGLGSVERFLEVFFKLTKSEARFEVTIAPGVADGVLAHDMQPLAVIRSSARTLLSVERSILNLMQHLSGIATQARRYVDAIDGTGAKLLDTRKTIAGLRTLEKYAVACGGGMNHRMDLASGILIKNNHIALGGGVAKAVSNALANRTKKRLKVQVEVRTPEELRDALENGAEALLLDNMTPDETRQSVEAVKAFARAAGKRKEVSTEASGGIVLENIRAYAEAGVNFISVGALTHSAKAADLSMRIQAEGK